MAQPLENYDIAVVGGGISGLGAAEAAVKRGYRTVLLEQRRLSGATSKSSLRIIHGGLRYLQHLDLPRVVESLRDQAALLASYPQFIELLPCIMPVEERGFRSRYPLEAAALLYRAIGAVVNGKSHPVGIRRAEKIPEAQTLLPQERLFFLWHDALLRDPSAFAGHIRSFLEQRGASVLEETKVRRISRQGADYRLVLERAGAETAVTARAVINTAGPWLHHVPKDFPSAAPALPGAWFKSFNVILRSLHEKKYAVGVFGEQKRSYFLVPRGEQSVLGTENIAYYGHPDEVQVSEEEIENFLQSFNRTRAALKLSLSDVAGVEAGVLPMKSLRPDGPRAYGLESISVSGRYIEVMSTKYTTYMSQACKVMDKLEPLLKF